MLFLALGIVAHLLVALGCAVVAQRHFAADQRHRHHLSVCAQNDWSNFQGATMLHGQPPTKHDEASRAAMVRQDTLERFGYVENRTSEPFIDAPANATWYDLSDIRPLCLRKVSIESGWPAKTLWVEHMFLVDVDAERRQIQRGEFPNTAYVRALPIKPILRGFILNTLLYSAAFFLLFATVVAPNRLRRNLRIRRGFCPACAYPVGGSPICTECGHNLS